MKGTGNVRNSVCDRGFRDPIRKNRLHDLLQVGPSKEASPPSWRIAIAQPRYDEVQARDDVANDRPDPSLFHG